MEHPIKRLLLFISFQQITFKLGNFTNGALSSGNDRFSLTCPCQKLRKTVERSVQPFDGNIKFFKKICISINKLEVYIC